MIKQSSTFKQFYNFFNKKWYFDRIYNEIFSQSILNSSYHFFYKTIDRGILENLGPFGIVNTLDQSAQQIKSFQTGFVIDYLAYFLGFILLFFLFLIGQNFLIPFFIIAYIFIFLNR